MKKERQTPPERIDINDIDATDIADTPDTPTHDSAKASSESRDFWELDVKRPRKYKKPDFAAERTETTAVGESAADMPQDTVRAEPIRRQTVPDKEKNNDNDTTATAVWKTLVRDEPTRYVTGRYTNKGGFRSPKKDTAEMPESVHYSRSGLLIREVNVQHTHSDIDFYSRFTENAERIHVTLPSVPYTEELPEVQYFSYVPQYAHMSRSQLDFYCWVRENIRHGRYPHCDPSYVQLYIYEILNLPSLIPPERGAELLANIWLHYRESEPRLDGYLCEWLPDYCLIHDLPIPVSLRPMLPELVPKALLKEFFCDLSPDNDEDMLLLSRILIDNSSDYDFRRSRWYEANREAFELHMPRAVAVAVKSAITERRGVFSLEKAYRMTKDSYCGAIVSAQSKRRIELEFCSFTRSAETRHVITAMVKYAENKLRLCLGVKAKLGVDALSAEDMATLDSYFAPMLPQKPQKSAARSAEDRYMPKDYLKNYESGDSGFDLDTAAAIERESWQNTELLTRGEFSEETALTEKETAPEKKSSEGAKKNEDAESEKSAKTEKTKKTEKSAEPKKTEKVEDGTVEGDSDTLVRDGVSAALRGGFHEFCRSKQMYDGVLADRINTYFLGLLGDIVLEEDNGSYSMIEDYREDVETWMKE